MQKKHFVCMLSFIVAMVTMPTYTIYANDPYKGNESEWLARCAVPQDSQEAADKCIEFKTYYSQQSSNLEEKVADMKKSSDALNDDLSNLATLIDDLKVQIDEMNTEIANAEANVATMQFNISDLDAKMIEKQAMIEELDTLVKARMKKEQASISTNRYIDVIMGAHDFVDFIRLIEGINLITESDQNQIDSATKARIEYKLQQDEQKRLEADLQLQVEEIEKRKAVVAQGKEEQEKMYAVYYEKQQNILHEMETAQADISSMQGNIAGINTNFRDDIFQEPEEPEEPDTPSDPEQPVEPDKPEKPQKPNGNGNTSWLKPIAYDWYCGTWYYPNSTSVHLGADYSGPVGAAVKAPANALVLYASAPFGANQFGERLGWPYGGGNTMHLLTQVNGTTYGVSFFHLSPGFLVNAGDLVKQGQTVAYSGNSGNSFGAHLHVEVINLGSMSITTAQSKFANTADFAWGSGWSQSSACSNRGAPCRERPEDIFGY